MEDKLRAFLVYHGLSDRIIYSFFKQLYYDRYGIASYRHTCGTADYSLHWFRVSPIKALANQRRQHANNGLPLALPALSWRGLKAKINDGLDRQLESIDTAGRESVAFLLPSPHLFGISRVAC
jgi:hypothetical protein